MKGLIVASFVAATFHIASAAGAQSASHGHESTAARLTKNWDGDVKAFDAVYQHILTMSDALTDGIVKQFPAKFSSEGTR